MAISVKWKTDFVGMMIDVDAWRIAQLDELRKINNRAGGAWVREAANNTPIPTWSGASRATFQQLAKDLGTSIAIGPLAQGAPDRVLLGLVSAIGSGVEEEPKVPAIGFVYETNLGHLWWNEYHPPTPGKYPQPYSTRVRYTPYGFQDRAYQVWESVAKGAKLVNPWKFLKTWPIK